MISLFCMLLSLPLAAAANDDATTIPTTGRPWHVPFSEASGQFRISVLSDVSALRVEQPLTLRVRIAGQGVIYQQPRRIPLAELPAFDRSFYIEDVESADKQLDPQTWEFVYRLKPRSLKVREIPSIPLAFYDPDIPFPESRFQIDYSDPLPLKVLPARIYEQDRPPLPESVYSLHGGPDILGRQGPAEAPALWLILVLLVTPPMLCRGWYQMARRYWPNNLEVARRQRSRAAKLALRTLDQMEARSIHEPALLSATVTIYLRQRLTLTAEEPTPSEAAQRVREVGCTKDLAKQTAKFYERCDALRFSGDSIMGNADLLLSAKNLVIELEEATCRDSPI